jgi:myosin heavy subunit
MEDSMTKEDAKENTLKQFEEYQERETESLEKLAKEKEMNEILEKELNTTKKAFLSLQEEFQNILKEKKALQEEKEQNSSLFAFYEKAKKEIAELKDKNVTLKTKVTSLENENAQLEQKNENLSKNRPVVSTSGSSSFSVGNDESQLKKENSFTNTIPSKLSSSIDTTPLNSQTSLWKIIDQMKNNDAKLTDVSLIDRNITDDDLKRIAVAMEKNTKVKRLDLSNNSKLTGSTIDSIAHMMGMNKTLEELIFDNCPIKKDGVQRLIAALQKNHTLIQMSCGLFETNEDIDVVEDLLDRNYESKN